VKGKGPIPLYCGHTCRQLAYQKRRHSGPMVMLAQDIATAKVRDVIRAEIWEILRQVGLVEAGASPPREKKRSQPTPLRLIEKGDDSGSIVSEIEH
jgi:hypothetical protein